MYLAKQPVRLDHQNQNQDHERRHFFYTAAENRIEITTRKILQHAHQQPADDSANDAVQTTQDHHRNHLQADGCQRRVHAAAHTTE